MNDLRVFLLRLFIFLVPFVFLALPPFTPFGVGTGLGNGPGLGDVTPFGTGTGRGAGVIVCGISIYILPKK